MAGAIAIVVVGWLVVRFAGAEPDVGDRTGSATGDLLAHTPFDRDLVPYEGQGAWVDVFDFAPAYQDPGQAPEITPAVVDEMADLGVRTLYIQAARNDPRSPEMIVDERLLAEFLLRAHERDMRVVGWYLPKFADVDADLAHLVAMSDFEVAGHAFDGVAVDIEFTEDVPDHVERGARLTELSQRQREATGDEALGAIVLPPVLTEVVNPMFWPSFPWAELAPLYDVWLPMSYWTFRSADSGYTDGYAYNTESTQRLRANLDQPDAVVHGIGGIGDEVTPETLLEFGRSLVDTGSIGGSIYDWRTMSPENRAVMAELFAVDLAGP